MMVRAKPAIFDHNLRDFLVVVNRLNGCTYCMAAHTAVSEMAGVDDSVITALRAGTPIADARLEALHIFAETINESRGWASVEQVDALIEAGYSKQTVLEVIAGTALKVLSNYTTHIVNRPPASLLRSFAAKTGPSSSGFANPEMRDEPAFYTWRPVPGSCSLRCSPKNATPYQSFPSARENNSIGRARPRTS
ncbi:carboxymuconolactone decarboxylase family protein [Ruegeria sp. ANG-R]|uniref:carboxymuconolactone decarboxylase family protein n=1 Tax=Ruegeria sp. ANG-R TaxID=1577903 RepID=UPI0012699938|nr:carboxymuconolactone decarboxylase family protein [Ruegeria sp. ANG-R]